MRRAYTSCHGEGKEAKKAAAVGSDEPAGISAFGGNVPLDIFSRYDESECAACSATGMPGMTSDVTVITPWF